VDDIIGNRQYGYPRGRLPTDQIFCISHMQEKKLECDGTVHQLFICIEEA